MFTVSHTPIVRLLTFSGQGDSVSVSHSTKTTFAALSMVFVPSSGVKVTVKTVPDGEVDFSSRATLKYFAPDTPAAAFQV